MNTAAPAALITGASSGIGAAFARALSADGYRLILVARRKDRLDKLAAELPCAEILAADLAEDGGLHSVEQRILAEPALECLVNNAGIGVPGCFWTADLQALDRMHRLHILAVQRLTHAALRTMVARRKGAIINVSSVAGFLHTSYALGYCASKAWLTRFTEGLYAELRAENSPVRLQALCPGFTRSEFHEAAGIDPNSIPRCLWMTAEAVVAESLRGLERNRPIVIPGWHNRLFRMLYGCLPPRLKHSVAIRYGRKAQARVAKPAKA